MRVGDIVPENDSFRKVASGSERLDKLIGSVGDIDFFLAKDVYHRHSVRPVLDCEHVAGVGGVVNLLAHTSVPKVYDCLSIDVLRGNFIRTAAR